jgi:hypothetical protein
MRFKTKLLLQEQGNERDGTKFLDKCQIELVKWFPPAFLPP